VSTSQDTRPSINRVTQEYHQSLNSVSPRYYTKSVLVTAKCSILSMQSAVISVAMNKRAEKEDAVRGGDIQFQDLVITIPAAQSYGWPREML
jgi:hypothetical protein